MVEKMSLLYQFPRERNRFRQIFKKCKNIKGKVALEVMKNVKKY